MTDRRPRLDAEIERLRAENERLAGALEGVRDNCTTLAAAILIAREALEECDA